MIDGQLDRRKSSKRLLLVMSAAILFSLASLFNIFQLQHSLLRGLRSINLSSAATHTQESIPFTMCNRQTPFRYDINTYLPPSKQKPILNYQINDWTKQNKILLLRNDGKFGNIGNRINSLLHAYYYARDNQLHLGMVFHSWAMDTIHSMFYESNDFEYMVQEMYNDLGIIVVRNQTQLDGYDDVISMNSETLFFYRSTNFDMDSWRETMELHIALLQSLYLRYNRGHGNIHTGERAQNGCATLDMLFQNKASDVQYSVIHARYLHGNAGWKLEQIAKTSGLTIEDGAMYMTPAYVKSVLKPLGMLTKPIILLSDGQLKSVERGLLNDEVIGPNLMVLSDKEDLSGADVILAVLADVFIGNPASVTSGFIARSRVALGYPDKLTQLFRRKRLRQWYSVCNDECVFNPWILGKWV